MKITVEPVQFLCETCLIRFRGASISRTRTAKFSKCKKFLPQLDPYLALSEVEVDIENIFETITDSIFRASFKTIQTQLMNADRFIIFASNTVSNEFDQRRFDDANRLKVLHLVPFCRRIVNYEVKSVRVRRQLLQSLENYTKKTVEVFKISFSFQTCFLELFLWISGSLLIQYI